MAKQKTEKNIPARKESNISIGFTLKSERLYAMVIFAFGFMLYFNTVFNDYNMDDELVTQNHRLTKEGISAIPEIFKSPYYQDEAGYKYEYRPMVLATFAIEHSLFGEHAWVSHLLNVIVYSLLCVLLFLVLKNLLKGYNIIFPFLATMLFAAHPVHTEVVASIKNRDEMLALGFSLLSLYYSLRFTKRNNWLLLLPVVVFFLLGILSKTTTLTFLLITPVLVLLFTEITFAQLMALTATLLLPAVFFTRLSSMPQQVMLVVLVLSISAVLYVLKQQAAFITALKNYFLKFQAGIKKPEADLPEAETLDTGFYKNKAAMLLWLSIIAVTFGIAMAGLHYGNIWLTCLPMLLWSILFAIGRNEIKLLLITPISMLSVLAIVGYPTALVPIEAALVVFLGSVFLTGNKISKIVVVANYLIYAITFIIFKESFFFLMVVVFAGLLSRRTYMLTVGVLIVSFGFYVKTLFNYVSEGRRFSMLLLNLPIIYIGALLVWRKKMFLVPRLAAIALPVLILIYSYIIPPTQRSIISSLQHSYYLLNHIEATNLSPTESVRPLIFIERPIGYHDPISIKLGTAMVVLGKYLKLIFIPYPLSFYYGYAFITPTQLSETAPLIILVIHALFLAIALFYFRKQPVVAGGLFIYLIAIFVFSNLTVPVPGAMGDRFLLIPSIGFCLLLAFILSKFFKQDISNHTINLKSLKTPFAFSLLLILLAYSGLTFGRNRNWKDRLTLFRNDIHAVENSAQAHNLLGLHLFIASNAQTDPARRQAFREEALPHLKRAVEIYPKFLNASFDYARLLDAMGRYDEAIVAYQHTANIDSNFTAPYFSMGILYQNMGKNQEAADSYLKYLRNHPKQMEVYANLSFAYFKMGDYTKSIEVNKRAIAAMPDNAFNPTVNIAKTFLKTNTDSALYYFEQAQRIDPAEPNVARFVNELRSKK